MGARHVTENCEQPVGESQVTSSEQMVIAIQYYDIRLDLKLSNVLRSFCRERLFFPRRVQVCMFIDMFSMVWHRKIFQVSSTSCMSVTSPGNCITTSPLYPQSHTYHGGLSPSQSRVIVSIGDCPTRPRFGCFVTRVSYGLCVVHSSPQR